MRLHSIVDFISPTEAMLDVDKIHGYETGDNDHSNPSLEVRWVNAEQACRSARAVYEKMCLS